MTSIRVRLLLWIGLPFTLVGILTLVASQVVLSRQINETFDDMLLNAAERLERRIHSVDGELRINMHYFSISTLGSRGEGKIFYRIRDDAGNMLAGFEGLEPPRPMPARRSSMIPATPATSCAPWPPASRWCVPPGVARSR